MSQSSNEIDCIQKNISCRKLTWEDLSHVKGNINAIAERTGAKLDYDPEDNSIAIYGPEWTVNGAQAELDPILEVADLLKASGRPLTEVEDAFKATIAAEARHGSLKFHLNARLMRNESRAQLEQQIEKHIVHVFGLHAAKLLRAIKRLEDWEAEKLFPLDRIEHYVNEQSQAPSPSATSDPPSVRSFIRIDSSRVAKYRIVLVSQWLWHLQLLVDTVGECDVRELWLETPILRSIQQSSRIEYSRLVEEMPSRLGKRHAVEVTFDPKTPALKVMGRVQNRDSVERVLEILKEEYNRLKDKFGQDAPSVDAVEPLPRSASKAVNQEDLMHIKRATANAPIYEHESRVKSPSHSREENDRFSRHIAESAIDPDDFATFNVDERPTKLLRLSPKLVTAVPTSAQTGISSPLKEIGDAHDTEVVVIAKPVRQSIVLRAHDEEKMWMCMHALDEYLQRVLTEYGKRDAQVIAPNTELASEETMPPQSSSNEGRAEIPREPSPQKGRSGRKKKRK
ncbi:hypothetical protein HDV00_002078 [Rhizophlyctis rosea]|nr:hypothetical protein HDV00_002078 [Rhizophlyctis rosea]